MLDRFNAYFRALTQAQSERALYDLLAELCVEMGFVYFALTHHVDVLRALRPVIRLHNYPAEWVAWFDAERLGPSDPVHRASHLTCAGFAWSRLPSMIHLTPRDRFVLERANLKGIGDGFTIPANIPGESYGSCSFATSPGASLPEDLLLLAQSIGTCAFERARGLYRMRASFFATAPRLTDRQRDCLHLAAQGKTDAEIAESLRISKETVIEYLKQARRRYGVTRRTMLAVHALYDGTLCFTDVLRR
jgi:LuxR family quorum-sensing system transcriptional regulator CciR